MITTGAFVDLFLPNYLMSCKMFSIWRDMGMEVCCTLGMLEKQQALELKKAGLTAYNHNLDTSREYYPNIITTRTYDERLETLKHVREAGINVCSGIHLKYKISHSPCVYILTLVTHWNTICRTIYLDSIFDADMFMHMQNTLYHVIGCIPLHIASWNDLIISKMSAAWNCFFRI